MANDNEECSRGYMIHTGNILNINEVKMKAGQNTTEELIESLRHVINSCSFSSGDKVEDKFEVNKAADYLALKLNSQEVRKDVKVSVKIFLRRYDEETLRVALTRGFQSLNTPIIESVVLALPGDDPIPLVAMHNVWKVLEEFVLEKKVLTIGVSDIDTDAFIALHEWAKVKPGIVQINLAHCCVVPPALQAFTREHGIQLLTHSDPKDILPDSVLKSTIGEMDHPLTKCMTNQTFLWATRYQIHIKCRGVLTSKGYIICLTK